MSVRPMTRGELARRIGCNPETIRYYEQIGLIPDPDRSQSGYRQYSAAHEQRLRFILRGRALGFTISDLKGLLGLVDRRAVTCAEVKPVAEAHLEAVRKKISDLKRMEAALRTMISSCSGAGDQDCPIVDALFVRDHEAPDAR